MLFLTLSSFTLSHMPYALRYTLTMKKLYYDPKKCAGCKTCEIVCSAGHSPSKDLFVAVQEENLALPRLRVYPKPRHSDQICIIEIENYAIACRQCKDHPCVNACMAGALEYDSAKGIIFDNQKCVGCWMCIMVCPYGATRRDSRKNESVRCDLCADTNEPRCAKNCPTRAISYTEEK